MKVATTDLNIPVVAQEGKNADALRKKFKKNKFTSWLQNRFVCDRPDARHMAIVSPSTNMLFVGTRKTTVWAVTDRNGD